MQQSFYSAISGASSHQNGLNIWSNNIANINNAGYKGDVMDFQSLVTSGLAYQNGGETSTANTTAFGVTSGPSRTNFTQGSIINTDNPYDMSLNGNGFFTVGDSNGNLKYTRDGSFSKNAEGYLVNSSGYYLYGVDLKKIKDNILLPNKSEKELKTNNVNKLSKIKIPDNAIYQPQQTKNLSLSINLNPTNHIKFIQKAYRPILYDNNQSILESRPLAEFIDIKSGDVIKINTSSLKGKPYVYGTDFTTLIQLQEAILKDREDIKIGLTGNRLFISNISGKKLNIDFSDMKPDVQNAMSFPPNPIVLGKETSFNLANLTQRQYYNTDFNALYANNESSLHIKQGDTINININGVSHKMVYGPSKGMIVAGKEVSKEDSFLTIKEFIDRVEKKSNLDVFIEHNRLYFQNASQDSINFQATSNNQQLIKSLGLPSFVSKIDSNQKISTDQLGVSTYSNTAEVFDSSGKKFFIKTSYVSQSIVEANKKESWYSSIGLYSGDKLLSKDLINGKIKFTKEGKAPTTEQFDLVKNSFIKTDKFLVNFNSNEKIAVDLTGDGDSKTSTNVRFIDSSINSKNIDGNRRGLVDGISIDTNGLIRINFSNQIEEIYGRVGVVDFINKNGLTKTGNNLFEESYHVGNGKIVYPDSGKATLLWGDDGVLRSTISQRTLESSNVDLTKGLTQLIVMQRAFSANAKAITTSDEMIKSAINLKS